MKINAGIRMVIGREETNVRIEDLDGSLTFLEFTLTPKELSALLSGFKVECNPDVRGLDKVGKRYQHQSFEVIIPNRISIHDTLKVREFFQNEVDEMEEGWIVDDDFKSSDSFFTIGDTTWARTIIKRWI